MKLLNEALQKSLAQNEALQSQVTAMQARMMDTVDRMVAALQPAAKRAHSPVGSSVESISIRSLGTQATPIVLDRATKALVSAAVDTTITETRSYIGIITELDMISGSCKVALEGADAEDRTSAVVTDPSVQRPNNPYVTAMSKLSPIRFLAKAELDADGVLTKLHISDVDNDQTPQR